MMKLFPTLITTLSALLVGQAFAAPVVKVTPGNAGDLIITDDNTVNATKPAPYRNATNPAPYRNATKPVSHLSDVATSWGPTGQLPLALVNNLGGGSVNAYVTGLDSTNRLVMLQPDGTFYYPTADPSIDTPQAVTVDCAIPLGAQGSTTQITIPDYISAARVWFAEGTLSFFTIYSEASGGPSLVEPSAVNPSDPSAGVNWGFVELTNTANGGLYANISYVDFVGLILGMKLDCADGSTQTAAGLSSDAVSSICTELKTQGASDGYPWGDLCMVNADGTPLRVLAPSDYVASNPTAFEDYWTDYNEQVWSQYTSNSLTVNTQAPAGDVNCKVSGDEITCDGDNRGYAKPTAGDIFGCNSGPFGILEDDNDVHRAVVPRLCAAFNRGTLLKEGGNIQPGLSADNYYSTPPSNWYSKFVHQYEVDGKGYAFPYDDVNPSVGVDQAGVVANPEPTLLTVIVGGPLSS